MRIALQFLLAMGLTINAAGASSSCSPIPGAGQIWSRPSVHWVFIGELHGSNETPAAFRDLFKFKINANEQQIGHDASYLMQEFMGKIYREAAMPDRQS